MSKDGTDSADLRYGATPKANGGAFVQGHQGEMACLLGKDPHPGAGGWSPSFRSTNHCRCGRIKFLDRGQSSGRPLQAEV